MEMKLGEFVSQLIAQLLQHGPDALVWLENRDGYMLGVKSVEYEKWLSRDIIRIKGLE